MIRTVNTDVIILATSTFHSIRLSELWTSFGTKTFLVFCNPWPVFDVGSRHKQCASTVPCIFTILYNRTVLHHWQENSLGILATTSEAAKGVGCLEGWSLYIHNKLWSHVCPKRVLSYSAVNHAQQVVLTILRNKACVGNCKTSATIRYYRHNAMLLPGDMVQYIPRNMHTLFALLCFVVVIHWLIFPYPSGLLHWHCGNLTIAPVPAKQPWSIWINTSCEVIMTNCITTTKQSTTKPCAYFLGYTV